METWINHAESTNVQFKVVIWQPFDRWHSDVLKTCCQTSFAGSERDLWPNLTPNPDKTWPESDFGSTLLLKKKKSPSDLGQVWLRLLLVWFWVCAKFWLDLTKKLIARETHGASSSSANQSAAWMWHHVRGWTIEAQMVFNQMFESDQLWQNWS